MKYVALISLSMLLSLPHLRVDAAEPVHFARDVLPILSANCFACHGPDEHDRQGGLRLDLEDDAKKKRETGSAISAGKPDESLILARLTSTDPDLVMPPLKSRKVVTAEQTEIIRRWISEGAKWQRHWSFEQVSRPQATLDQLVSDNLNKHGLTLRPSASPHALVRRLSLDLTGLPPTVEQADEFAKDPTPAAYEKLIDTLLASPQFGEHWGRMWLDLARYADTKGYEKDLGRTMWPYRDWVIQAFNTDMPLDQFTLEQLAGDLLSNPTPQQIVATAFHRNTMANDEGGTDDEEFRVAAVKDRLDTTIQVWMGLTMGCAKCHSHKYDPISNDDYYRLYAIFNQTEDADRYDDAPLLEVLTPEQRSLRDKLQTQVAQLEGDLRTAESNAENGTDQKLWSSLPVLEARSDGGATLTAQPDQSIVASEKSEPVDVYTVTLSLPAGTYTALRLEALISKFNDGQPGLGRNPADPNFVVSEIAADWLDCDQVRSLKLINARSDFAQEGWPVAAAIDGDPKTGWAVSPRSRERHVAFFDLAEPLKVGTDAKLRLKLSQNYGNRLTLGRFRLSLSTAEPSQLVLPVDSPECRKVRDELAAAKKAQADFRSTVAMLPILKELPATSRRVTKVHKRGNFLDPGEQVEPALLSSFNTQAQASPVDRVAVAKWLTSRDNPLTARVWANRVWSRLFGMGLVETEEDFGALGSAPSNPRLLDLLAAEYRDSGWSLKKLLKTIVLSQTYRQASESTAELQSIDPRNTLMSRGSRYRLSAEAIRDQALATAGLLSLKAGGPPVMPPQPAGMWRSTYNGKTWIDAEGEDRFRRGIYTYLKRTTPYPSFTTFDGGSGEVCQIRRIRTNTPLQALVTLNDPVFMEAAAGLARRMMATSDKPQARIASGLRLALIRPLQKGEEEPLVRLQREAQQLFQSAPEQAAAVVKMSRGLAADPKADVAELASWIVTANAILNLDEYLSRN